MCKTNLVAVAAVLLASLPSFAAALPPGNPPPAGPVAAAASLPALSGCGQTLGAAPALELRGAAARIGEAAGPICPLAVGGVDPSSRPFHGHCKCSCSIIPDCNTSADCGGAPCLAGITCC